MPNDPVPAPPAPPALAALTRMIQSGLPAPTDAARSALGAFLAERYPQRQVKAAAIRDAYGPSGEGHTPFAGVLPEDSPPSGAYGGMSVVWFPLGGADGGGSLLTFVVGTLGLSPDEGILGRPGHRRYVQAMRTHLQRLGVSAWAKPDPAAIHADVPATVRGAFPQWESAWERYGPFVYAAAALPPDTPPEAARATVAAFFDLYGRERGWKPLAAHAASVTNYLAALADGFFQHPGEADVIDLLRERRFVVLQGPPGSGKTRLADRVRASAAFGNRGLPVQFHPAVTYEDFVVGLAPRVDGGSLGFHVRAGWLLQAVEEAERCGEAPFLLGIDEINRGDLAKVLGEAISLFEPGQEREITLPHAWNGRARLRLPANLHVLATMNTADRSIASIDLAIRRRFAFVTLHPDRAPVAAQGLPLATEAFDRLSAAFLEFAADDVLPLIPGQAYFLANDVTHLTRRLRHDLLPLLDEYLAAGLLGGAAAEVQTVRDWLADQIGA